LRYVNPNGSCRRDPDGNGVELYWNRLKEPWPRDRNGGIEMYTRPLDWDALFGEAPARR
jgi:catechol 2,3-dioxygenase